MAALDPDDTAPLLETWDSVENDNPQDLEVPNWANDAKFKEFSKFMTEFGVHTHMAETIFQYYGPSAMTVVQSDPIAWFGKWLGLVSKRPTALAAG